MSYTRMAKFCANLTFLFTDTPFVERYKLAKDVGFRMVESGFPLGFTLDECVDAKRSAGIEQILLNTFTGNVSKGELGFAALLGNETKFRNSLKMTIQFAKALDIPKVHIMAGVLDTFPTVEHHITYERNIQYATEMLAAANLIGLIEPINSVTVPNYYLNSYDRAIDIVRKINHPNLKLMLDVFHLQQIRGSITKTIKDVAEHIGHIQIAQVPNRNAPNCAGEIDYRYVLPLFEKYGYTDWIGLEYTPMDDLNVELKWIQDFGYTL